MNEKIINAVLAVCPDIYYSALIWRMKQDNELIINNLRRPFKSEKYDPGGPYITMYPNLPHDYQWQINLRIFDQNGIPLIKKGNNLLYNPTSLIQYGLSEYGYYLSSKSKLHFEHSKSVCDWLLDNQDDATGLWYYNFDFFHSPSNTILKKPWASAMSQGEAVSLLTRIYRITHNSKLLVAAEKAFHALSIPVADGGLYAEFCGNAFYEEFPTSQPNLTLNGFMFCLFGLYDLYDLACSPEIKRFLEAGVSSLEKMLPLYDDSLMSSYDLCHFTYGNETKNLSKKYHIIHIKQLFGLNSVMPSAIIKMYADKWKRQATLFK